MLVGCTYNNIDTSTPYSKNQKIITDNLMSNEAVVTPVINQLGSLNSDSVSKQIIINQKPEWQNTGIAMTKSEIVQRFSFVLLDRQNMSEQLPGYRSLGFNGHAFVYFSGYGMAGPSGLDNLGSQILPCTLSQWQLSVFSNSVTVDPGDFCDIHDAIVFETSLNDYPDIYPDESWFLHDENGNRLFNGHGGDGIVYYVMNPSSTGLLNYYARRLLREVIYIDASHKPLAGVDGVFIDNLNSTFYLEDELVPTEYESLEHYSQAKIEFLRILYNYLSSNNVLVMGNLSDMGDPDEWKLFMSYLDVLEAESWVLDWGKGLPTEERIESDLLIADDVLKNNKKFIGVFQGDNLGTHNEFAYACFLLITDGRNAFFRYKNYYGNYSEYYELPEYNLGIGMPLGSREKISNNPAVYNRKFECGEVEVNLTDGTSEIVKHAGCE